MYKSLYIFFVLFVMIVTSCSKDFAQIDDELINDHLEALQIEATKDPSGVYIAIEESGNSNKPNELNYITIHYEGAYLDGEIFDTSFDGDPFSSYLFNLIEGWKIGIPYFGEGGKGHLFIPSKLAYGSDPPGNIRKNAVMQFYIELLKVE